MQDSELHFHVTGKIIYNEISRPLYRFPIAPWFNGTILP